MKITKKQIRKIIKKVISENEDRELASATWGDFLSGGTPVSDAFNQLTQALQSLERLDRSMVIYELIDHLTEMTKK